MKKKLIRNLIIFLVGSAIIIAFPWSKFQKPEPKPFLSQQELLTIEVGDILVGGNGILVLARSEVFDDNYLMVVDRYNQLNHIKSRYIKKIIKQDSADQWLIYVKKYLEIPTQ